MKLRTRRQQTVIGTVVVSTRFLSPFMFLVFLLLCVRHFCWQQHNLAPKDDDYVALSALRKTSQHEIELLHQEATEEEKTIVDEQRASRILHVLQRLSSQSALQDTTSPQYSAFSWLVDEDQKQLNAEDSNLAQRYVLALLYFATTGGGDGGGRGSASNWKESESLGWLSSHHECDWNTAKFGGKQQRTGVVECNDQKEATQLYLVNNMLRGSLPSEIHHLSRLTCLDLANNELSGTLPEELGYLTTLEYVRLSSNNFDGLIPRTMGGINNLEQLLVHQNNFEGTVPDTLCDLKKQGRFFNLWSNCRNSTHLSCTCCTVCCDEKGKNCGPMQ